MNEFQNALEFLHESLSQLRAQGADLRASREALQRLMEAQPSEPAPRVVTSVQPTNLEPQQREESFLLEPKSEMPGFTPLTSGDKRERLAALEKIVAPCPKCPHLARTRTQTVFGVGNPDAEVMFVGEAPGADEDLQGEPFVGRAGQTLTRMIKAMGFSREQVYSANILKCRPDMPAGSRSEEHTS